MPVAFPCPNEKVDHGVGLVGSICFGEVGIRRAHWAIHLRSHLRCMFPPVILDRVMFIRVSIGVHPSGTRLTRTRPSVRT